MFGAGRERAARHAAVKRALTEQLAECVKAIQFRNAADVDSLLSGADDLSAALCVAVEAILLHGVKDTFLRKARFALITGDVAASRKPEPSFWPLLLVLSHRDTIRQIGALNLVQSEVGQCRAWVRVALNDCLLSSYCASIVRNADAAKSYYQQWAYARDSDALDVARRIIEGVESCAHFELPVNSSLLNSWPEETLALAGIWTPTMRSSPIAPGIDVASSMTLDGSTATPDRRMPIPQTSGLGRVLAMDPDEALNYILSNTPENFMDEMRKNLPEPSVVEEPESTPVEKEEAIPAADSNDEDDDDGGDEEPTEPRDSNVSGNSILGKSAWSAEPHEEPETSAGSTTPSGGSLKSHGSASADAAGTGDDPFVKTPNLREVVRGLRKELNISTEECETAKVSAVDDPTAASPVSPDDPLLTGLGFEVVSKSLSSTFDQRELQSMISLVGSLSREYGLGSQDHSCVSCGDMLGTEMCKAQVCNFTSKYFCSSCMDPNACLIPARVIHNWDFRRYAVSKRSALFLSEFQNQPLINMKKSNPLIYSGVAEMAQLQTLRIQLNFLKAYLFTCRENVIEELQKRVWPREYLYEHIHLYSISDLTLIYNGALTSQLQKLVNYARSHVNDCWLCSQKGFICEKCKNPKILFPFDVDSTYRCGACSSVFHANCLSAADPCPKCERKNKRRGKTLLEAVHTNFLSQY